MLKMTSVEQKATFFRELATMVQAGMTIGESLGTIRERMAPGRLRMAAIDAADKARRGTPFSDTMELYPDVFSAVEIAMVRAGEQSGHLDRLLGQIATYLEAEYALRQTISRETFYPKIVFAFIILFPTVLKGLLAYFGPGGSMLAAILVMLKGFLGLAALAVVVIAVYYVIRHLLANSRELRRGVDTLKLTLPVMGPVVRRIALAKFSRALAAMYEAGVSLPRAVGLAADLTGNAALRDPMKAAVAQLEGGKGVYEVMRTIPHMDNMALQMLHTGETTGNIDVMMARVADHFDEASASSLKRMTTLIVPIATIIAGIVVAIMMVQAYSGYFNAIFESQ
ncbi:MAG TPA: type II secretion system F family protein [Armatimonadota bacterium]|jgi:type II secretory pathway component PulF